MNNVVTEKTAPIALFVYNRLECTQQTVEALQRNELASSSDLIIYSDGAKNESQWKSVNDVRRFCAGINGFRSVRIVHREKNLGLAGSIIDGVTDVVNKHGTIIVVEDDLVTSPFFLRYMNDALTRYENESKVTCIHAYIYPPDVILPETFFLRGANCWGWGTWKRGWEMFERDGKTLLNEITRQNLEYMFNMNGSYDYIDLLRRQIRGEVDSWAIRWYASTFIKETYTLYPGKTLVYNIGGGDDATHTKSISKFRTELADKPIGIGSIPIEDCRVARESFARFFHTIQPSLGKQIMIKMYRFLQRLIR